MGRGRGFHPGAADLNVGPVGSGLAMDHFGDVRAGVAPDSDGRERPLFSPHLLGIFESQKNRLLSSPDHLSNLDRDAVSVLIERKIKEFFKPPPYDHSDSFFSAFT